MQMVGPLGRYLPQWLRAPCKGSGPARSTQYADGRTLGRYLPISTPVVKGARQREWPRHLSTHTHTLDLTHHNVCFRDPIRYTCQLCIPNRTCMQAPIPTLCISAKKTHNKGSRTRPIMSTLMPRSGIQVICSRATLSCDSSY